jgi:hypothetical protein
VSGDAGGVQLIRKWYYSAFINSTETNGVRLNLTAYNKSNDIQFTLVSNASGYTNSSEIIEYVNNNGVRNYYSNYTMSVGNLTMPPYLARQVNFSRNITGNLIDTLTLTADSNKPVIRFNTPYDLEGLWTNYIYVNVTVNESNLKNISYRLYNSTALMNTSEFYSPVYEMNYTNLLVGDYRIVVDVWDNALNFNSSTIRATILESEYRVTLNAGWNLISIMTKTNTTGDRNISLVRGYNLIGYSSTNEKALSEAIFTNSSGYNYSWSEAVSNGKLKRFLPYWDRGKYRYLTTESGFDDTNFRNRGYKIYANNDGVLTIPNITGSMSGETYNWSNLKFWNGSIMLNVTDAVDSSWISSPLYTINNGAWQYIRGNTMGGAKTYLTSFEGVFILGKRNNIELVRQN